MEVELIYLIILRGGGASQLAQKPSRTESQGSQNAKSPNLDGNLTVQHAKPTYIHRAAMQMTLLFFGGSRLPSGMEEHIAPSHIKRILTQPCDSSLNISISRHAV